MEKINRLRDINGQDLYAGDHIILTEYISMIDEVMFTEGVVEEENGKFYLKERQLELLDVFKITEHGKKDN